MYNYKQACGTKVVIKKLENKHISMGGGTIIIPDCAVDGHNLNKGIVLSVGPEATKEGINVNDIVLYDFYSTFYTDGVLDRESAIVNSENVIVKINEDTGDITPYGNSLLTRVIEEDLSNRMDGLIYIPEKSEKNTKYTESIIAKFGEKVDSAKIELSIGQKVMALKEGNIMINYKSVKYYVINIDTVIAVINE